MELTEGLGRSPQVSALGGGRAQTVEKCGRTGGSYCWPDMGSFCLSSPLSLPPTSGICQVRGAVTFPLFLSYLWMVGFICEIILTTLCPPTRWRDSGCSVRGCGLWTVALWTKWHLPHIAAPNIVEGHKVCVALTISNILTNWKENTSKYKTKDLLWILNNKQNITQ